MKNKGLIVCLIVLLSIICVLLVGLMYVLIKNGGISFKGLGIKESSNLYLKREYDFQFLEVNLDIQTANIDIKSGDKFEIAIYSNNSVWVDDSSDILSVTEKSNNHSWFNMVVSKVELFIPDDYAGKIKINSNFGDINIGSFNKADINISVDYGNVFIESAKKVNIEQDKGNASIGIVRDAIVTNSLGNVVIDKVTGYMEVSEDCGNIHIKEANINKNSSLKNNLGNITVDKLNEVYVDASNDLGNINVKNHYNSDIVLTIHNDCGNITVNN